MRIVYLHQYFNTPAMPGGTRSYEMARRLVGNGHEVHMVTAWPQPDGRRGWFETVEAGIRVHWLPVPYSNHMNYRERIARFLHFAWASARYAAGLPADLIFATSTPLTIALPAVYAARRIGVPMVFEVRDLWPQLPIAMGALRNPLMKYAARKLERFAYRESARVVALSPGMAEGIASTGYPPERIHIIPNGADLDVFRPDIERASFRARLPGVEDRPLIGYIGTLGPINGVAYLVDVAAAASRLAPELRFLIVGDGKDLSTIRERARQVGVLDRTLFMLPAVPKEKVPEAFAACDVVLSLFIDLPEMTSNSANKFFDGLAAGRAIAINYGGWQAEMLQQCGAGIRLPVHDAESAARQLGEWAVQPGALDRAGRAARQLAETQFGRDALAHSLEQALRSVVS
jgi:glycosyltransferase involved in cell wall biosynthesis